MYSDKTNEWQHALINAVTDPKELIELLDLDPDLLPEAKRAALLFPLKVPHSFIKRMRKGDAQDPLLRQVLPIGDEHLEAPGFTTDPLHETKYNPVPGLLHKYYGRVLLTLASACAANCRFCFRRHFPYEDNNPGTAGWNAAIEYIARNDSITEVILSGGDPLVVNDKSLKNLTDKLANIPHLKRLRIHSRLPIVLPERVSAEFCEWIKTSRLKTVIVVHSNHPSEINEEVHQAMLLLRSAGATLLNQSVLLKGVNDDAQILADLSHALFAANIQPYYLHALDKVQGAAHFDQSYAFASDLHQKLTQLLPGYLVPKLVCEQPGAAAKTSITPDYLFTG